MKKIFKVLCLVSLLMVNGFTFAVPEKSEVYAAGIKDSIQNSTGDSVVKQVDQSGNDAIKIIRQVAITVCVIMLAWIGFTKFFSGSAQSLADMKVRLGVLVIALVFAFKTEMVTGALLNLFGVNISSL